MRSIFILSLLILQVSTAFAGTINPQDNVILCLKKPGRGGQVIGYKAILINKTQRTVQYLSNNGGNELNDMTSFTQTRSQIFIETNSGVAETVLVDTVQATARWYENAYPSNPEVYPSCTSLPKFNESEIRSLIREFALN